MIYDLQKASVLKRISAWLLDAILLVIIVTGAAALIAEVSDFDSYSRQHTAAMEKYEAEYGVRIDTHPEGYEAMSEQELEEYRQLYKVAYDAWAKDEPAVRAYTMCQNLILVMISLSILAGYLVIEFIIPLLIGNGQTLGKKVFSIAVVRTNCVRITPVVLFIRTFLGKYTLETMLPVLVLVLMLTGSGGWIAITVIGILLIVQVVLMVKSGTNSLIHDKLADTVTVDMASQMIFATEEDLLDYKKKVAAEKAERQTY